MKRGVFSVAVWIIVGLVFVLLTTTRSQDLDSAIQGDDFDYYDRNQGFPPIPRRPEYTFKTSDITNLNQELRNGVPDASNRKLPVSIYIYGGRFLQITNLKNRDAWSTLPFTDENLRQLGILFTIKELEVIESTLRAPSIPSTLSVLNVSSSKVVDGSLAEVLRKCDKLEELSIRRSGDIYISDLPPAHLELFETAGGSLIYAAKVQLPQIKHIRFYKDTDVDPRILREFGQIFSHLESIDLDHGHYNQLKGYLGGIPSLNWINVWRLNSGMLRNDSEWDGLLIQAYTRARNASSNAIYTLIRDGNWKYLKYS